MPTLNAFDNGDVRTTILVGCFELWDFPKESVAPAMTSRRARDLIKYEEPTGGNNMPMVFSHTQGLDAQPSETVSPTLRAGGAGMAVAYDEFNDSIGDTHHTLRAGTKQSTGVIMESNVRRLTPVECERLQGFPDDWTAGQSDSQRYKQMGNAVAVPVVEWIIQGISDTL
jgi:site-specific DNA-cytosine methylase